MSITEGFGGLVVASVTLLVGGLIVSRLLREGVNSVILIGHGLFSRLRHGSLLTASALSVIAFTGAFFVGAGRLGLAFLGVGDGAPFDLETFWSKLSSIKKRCRHYVTPIMSIQGQGL